MVTIAIANNKGGVGKTTTALCVADALSRAGKRVLVVDMDPQCNTTTTAHGEIEGVNTMFDYLKEECSIEEALQKADENRRFDLIPNDPLLSVREAEFASQVTKLKLLKRGLKTLAKQYDYCLIDTPPQFGFYTTTSLLSCDGVVVPIDAEKFAVDGLGSLLKYIDGLKVENEDLEVYGVLVTKVDMRHSETKVFLENMPTYAEHFGFKIFDSKIRVCADLAKAQSRLIPVYDYDRHSKASFDYDNFVDELQEVV